MGARERQQEAVGREGDRERSEEPEDVRRVHPGLLGLGRLGGKDAASPLLHGLTLADAYPVGMEGGLGPFGGDPEDLLRGLREFAEQQAESVQEAQREQFATLTLNTAVELTSAALSQLQAAGSADEQAIALRDAMRVLFPEAVALVSAARQGFMREG